MPQVRDNDVDRRGSQDVPQVPSPQQRGSRHAGVLFQQSRGGGGCLITARIPQRDDDGAAWGRQLRLSPGIQGRGGPDARGLCQRAEAELPGHVPDRKGRPEAVGRGLAAAQGEQP